MLRRSGGVVVVQWTPPVDMGGVALQEYVAQVYNVDVNGTVCVQRISLVGLLHKRLTMAMVCVLLQIVGNPDTQINVAAPTSSDITVAAVHGVRAVTDTAFAIKITARNLEGLGDTSEPVVFSTLSAVTQPSAPALSSVAVDAGVASLAVTPPVDFGGASSVSYALYIRRAPTSGVSLYERVPTAGTSLSIDISNLHAATAYQVFAQASHAGGDVLLPNVTVSVDTGSMALLLDPRTDGPTAEALFAVLSPVGTALRIGGADSATIVTLGIVTLEDISDGRVALDSAFASTSQSGAAVRLTGTPSAALSFTTKDADDPARCPPPVFVSSTGGSFAVAMESPTDTGGLPVTAFLVVVTPLNMAAFLEYIEVRTVTSLSFVGLCLRCGNVPCCPVMFTV